MRNETLNSTILFNAQLLLRKAVLEADLSPSINDTAGFSAKLFVQHCGKMSTHEAECEAQVAGFRLWNVSLLIY